MSASSTAPTRLELAHDMALEMVRFDRRIERAQDEHHWAEAAALLDTREELVHVRMDVLRRYWLERRHG